MMKVNQKYYLKNKRLLMGTSHEIGDAMIVDMITPSKMVCGHFVGDTGITINCMTHEFSKIFTSKKVK